MPIYEFACEACRHGFEELVGTHVGLAEADVRCPACGSEKISRQISMYAPLHRRMTTNQKKALEGKRSVDYANLKKDFSRKMQAKRAAKRPKSGE